MNSSSAIFLSLLAFSFLDLHAQGVTIGSSFPPDPSAILDLQSQQGGFALPRLTTAQRNAIQSPIFGLQVYNVETDCLEMFFASGGWQAVRCGCQSFPSAVFSSPPVAPGLSATFSAPQPGLSYSWSFEGGQPATAVTESVQVIWSSSGTWGVTLTVTDAQGCSSSYTDSITISNCPPSGNQLFSFTGGVQSFVVPACVTQIQVDMYGASAGNGGVFSGSSGSGGSRGLGGRLQTTLSVTPGETLFVYVGGQGANSTNTSSGVGGYNGGGVGPASGGSGGGGGGGGASDIRRGGTALTNRVAVAGGGGGGGGSGSASSSGGSGAAGGGLTAANGSNSSGGFAGGGGGTQSAGGGAGEGGTNGSTSGSLGLGGSGAGSGLSVAGGGGGGGGYYGGGGGGNTSSGSATTASGGGGGGSSFSAGSNTTHSPGVRIGNGQVSISW